VSVIRARVFRLAFASLIAAARMLGAQEEVPADRVKIADAVRADLAKLSQLERAQFTAHKRYTADIKSLDFTPASGATISISYASARTFSASASHPRLAPFLCFVILSAVESNSPADKPFCTDARYRTAATALARMGSELDSSRVGPPRTPVPPPATPVAPLTSPSVMPVTTDLAAEPPTITPAQFAERLRVVTGAKSDSVIVVVQFAVKDARYDPSRGVLEVAVEQVPLPLAGREMGAARPSLSCFTRPAFVCGETGLTYIARDLLHVPRSNAPDPEVLRSGLTLHARFVAGRRDDTSGPTLTLLALSLQAKGEVVSHWEATVKH
jgi:hypothetical protein